MQVRGQAGTIVRSRRRPASSAPLSAESAGTIASPARWRSRPGRTHRSRAGCVNSTSDFVAQSRWMNALALCVSLPGDAGRPATRGRPLRPYEKIRRTVQLDQVSIRRCSQRLTGPSDRRVLCSPLIFAQRLNRSSYPSAWLSFLRNPSTETPAPGPAATGQPRSILVRVVTTQHNSVVAGLFVDRRPLWNEALPPALRVAQQK